LRDLGEPVRAALYQQPAADRRPAAVTFAWSWHSRADEAGDYRPAPFGASSRPAQTVYAVIVARFGQRPQRSGRKPRSISPGPSGRSACRQKGHAMDPDSRTRAAIEEHWRASEGGMTEAEHAIYAEDAILDYPQSGERFRSRATIAAQRGGHPADRHFTVRRITGSGEIWVSEVVITYDG